MRSAPRAPRRAAPVVSAGRRRPRRGRACICAPSRRGQRESARATARARWRRCAGRSRRAPRRGCRCRRRATSPHSARPGSSRWPGLRRKKVTVRVACTTGPSARPVVPSRPLGTSTASDRLARGVDRPRRPRPPSPSSGRDEAGAEQRVDDQVGAGRAVAGVERARRRRPSARPWRRRRPCSARASPSRPRRTSITRSRSSRAATKPSPPLLPGPHSDGDAAPGARDHGRGRVGDGAAGVLHQRRGAARRRRWPARRPGPSRRRSAARGLAQAPPCVQTLSSRHAAHGAAANAPRCRSADGASDCL